jgi:Na+-transporting NADH:ubiquinone oxidoreductase subunit B
MHDNVVKDEGMKKFLISLLEKQKKYTSEGGRFPFLHPISEAIENFFLQNLTVTAGPPHIRDAVDVKRWMFLVIYALIPCILMAIWNTGVQKFVYSSGSPELIQNFYASCHSLFDYWYFVSYEGRFWIILKMGLLAFLPVMCVSYLVGGAVEVVFACIRKKPIEEGLLVSGMLFALILPPTIPLWMVAFGVATGITFGKELFGGTGMNIVNPALCCRIILFFTFPIQMAGDVWVGTNPTVIKRSLQTINRGADIVDSYTQATPLARYNIPATVRRIDVDAIAANFPNLRGHVPTWNALVPLFKKYAAQNRIVAEFGSLSHPVLQGFATATSQEGGLGLSTEGFLKAKQFADLQYSQGILTDWNLFLGNRLGSMGETSVLGALLGMLLLAGTGVGSLRTIIAVFSGALLVGLTCNLVAFFFLPDRGAYASAAMTFPAYKHLLMGGLAFGAVFMATDPVSSPALPFSKVLYGLLIGGLSVVIRIFNPAYPEGVMLAIFFANIAAPLIDHLVADWSRRGRYVPS